MAKLLISDFDVGKAFFSNIKSLNMLLYTSKLEDIMKSNVRINHSNRFKDLSGNRYGMLIVKKYLKTVNNRSIWLCKCDCGNTKEIPTSYLTIGDTKSCGCRYDTIDEIGNKYNKLTVIKRIRNKNGRGAKWLCKCDCGNECKVFGGVLRNGQRKSCGCLHEVNIEKTGLKILYGTTKRKCKLIKREFSLTLDQYYSLIKNNCFYCNSEPSQIIKRCKSKKIQIIYNGIDRIDSSKGYTVENCVTCCKKCNRSKSDLSLNDWKDHLLKIVNWMKLK